jgi:hypothetical protein
MIPVKLVRRLVAVAATVGLLTFGAAVPAYADTAYHRVCSTGYGIDLNVNWPVTITVRPNGTIVGVAANGNPYLNGIVPPGVSFVNGSSWISESYTNDLHGVTVHATGQIQTFWLTEDVGCQSFWSF